MQEESKSRAEEVEKVIAEARAQWDRLGTYIDEAERSFLLNRMPALHKWFGLQEDDLENWNPGSLRSTVHDRVQLLLITPLVEKMCQRVTFVSPFRQEEEQPYFESVLERIADAYEKCLKPVVAEARSADTALTKKIKKTEKEERAKGIVALGMNDTKRVAALKRERPQIWEPVQAALEAFAAPSKHLKAFLVDELAEDMVKSKAGAVAVVASRAICDWQFQRSCMEYKQLQEWWRKTKATLQQRERLWTRLMEKEGLLIRRIEAGMEDVSNRRHRYSVYATFGGSEMEVMSLFTIPGAGHSSGGEIPPKVQESVNLLSTVVSDIAKRLKAIRGSALWRVIQTARGIHKELCEEDSSEEVPPWKAATAAKGATALLEELGWAQEDGASTTRTATPGEEGVLDAALAAMGRLERISVIASDVLNFFRQDPSTCSQDVSGALGELVQTSHDLCEDLLSLMDDPSKAAAKAWLQTWDSSFASGTGARLESAMAAAPFKPDSELSLKDRTARTKRLLLARGLQIFLSDEGFRAQAVLPLSRAAEPRSARSAAGAARPAALASSRRSELPSEQDGDSILGLSAPPSPRVVPGLSSPGGYPQVSSRGSPHSRGHEGAPWPPETPSTACEDLAATAAVRPASSKFVDGQCVFLRPDSPGVRLSPLSPKSRKASCTALGLDMPPGAP